MLEFTRRDGTVKGRVIAKVYFVGETDFDNARNILVEAEPNQEYE